MSLSVIYLRIEYCQFTLADFIMDCGLQVLFTYYIYIFSIYNLYLLYIICSLTQLKVALCLELFITL